MKWILHAYLIISSCEKYLKLWRDTIDCFRNSEIKFDLTQWLLSVGNNLNLYSEDENVVQLLFDFLSRKNCVCISKPEWNCLYSWSSGLRGRWPFFLRQVLLVQIPHGIIFFVILKLFWSLGVLLVPFMYDIKVSCDTGFIPNAEIVFFSKTCISVCVLQTYTKPRSTCCAHETDTKNTKTQKDNLWNTQGLVAYGVWTYNTQHSRKLRGDCLYNIIFHILWLLFCTFSRVGFFFNCFLCTYVTEVNFYYFRPSGFTCLCLGRLKNIQR